MRHALLFLSLASMFLGLRLEPVFAQTDTEPLMSYVSANTCDTRAQSAADRHAHSCTTESSIEHQVPSPAPQDVAMAGQRTEERMTPLLAGAAYSPLHREERTMPGAHSFSAFHVQSIVLRV